MNYLFRSCMAVAFMAAAAMVSAATPPLIFVDADTLTVINRPMECSGPVWQRVDVDRYPSLTPKVRQYYSYPTGMAVAFRTDSPYLYAEWNTTGNGHGVNTTLIAQSGLALYIKYDGKWIYAGVGKPRYNKLTHGSMMCEHMADSVKECLLYLPIYDGIDSLRIGVAPDSKIEALGNPFPRGKMIVVGSSITHGSSVGNPAMAYPARLERDLDIEVVNLGASGQCRLEMFYADIVADSKADVLLFDTFSNPTADIIDERLEPFVARIREAHPHTPLIFLNTLRRETTNFNQHLAEVESAKVEAARRGMEYILKRYDNVYFIDPGMPIGDDHDGTVDGVHPSDLGHERILEVIEPQIRAIVDKTLGH